MSEIDFDLFISMCKSYARKLPGAPSHHNMRLSDATMAEIGKYITDLEAQIDSYEQEDGDEGLDAL